MKYIALLLVWGSLAPGALSAATAYLASLDLPDEQLIGLTLTDPPEKEEASAKEEKPAPDKKPKKPDPVIITAELLAQLRADAELRDDEAPCVRVKEFSLKRWRGKGYFLLALVGLLAGGLISRRLAAAGGVAGGPDGGDAVDSPQKSLETIHVTLQELQTATSDESTRLDAIVQRIDELQKGPMQSFVDARPGLIASLGLGRFAALMDSYASAERQINRAWSTAVDRYPAESVACLNEAVELIAETRTRLSS